MHILITVILDVVFWEAWQTEGWQFGSHYILHMTVAAESNITINTKSKTAIGSLRVTSKLGLSNIHNIRVDIEAQRSIH